MTPNNRETNLSTVTHLRHFKYQIQHSGVRVSASGKSDALCLISTAGRRAGPKAPWVSECGKPWVWQQECGHFSLRRRNRCSLGGKYSKHNRDQVHFPLDSTVSSNFVVQKCFYFQSVLASLTMATVPLKTKNCWFWKSDSWNWFRWSQCLSGAQS